MAQVPNKNIDNASGQVVRLDIQNTGKAIATHNFGPRNDAGTILPCEFLADDTTNKLLIRKSSGGDQANPNPTSGTAADFFVIGNLDTEHLGLLPRTGTTTFPMTGQLIVDDGSAANAPAIAFDGDPDTGIFRVGSNTIGFATAGVERVEISDNGLDMSNGLPIRFQDSSGAPFVALKSPSSVSDNRTFTLPATTGTAGQFLSVSSSNHSATNAELEFSTVNGVPRGSVFCIAHTSIPSGYLECNGDALPNGTGTVQGVTADFSQLRALVGANLPDLRGEFVRGFDNGKGTDSGRSMLSSQSDQNKEHNHTASTSISDPGHFHHSFRSGNSGESRFNSTLSSSNFPASGTGAGNLNEAYNIVSKGSAPNVGRTSTKTTGVNAGTNIGNHGGNEARPRNIAMMYIIKF